MTYTASMSRYEIETYTTETGKAPFEVWLKSLRTAAPVWRLPPASNAAIGDFGDWKSLSGAKGIFEMRIHYAQGYRVFYTVVGQKVVLFLAGSTKQEQDKTIAKAKEYLADYNERVRQ